MAGEITVKMPQETPGGVLYRLYGVVWALLTSHRTKEEAQASLEALTPKHEPGYLALREHQIIPGWWQVTVRAATVLAESASIDYLRRVAESSPDADSLEVVAKDSARETVLRAQARAAR